MKCKSGADGSGAVVCDETSIFITCLLWSFCFGVGFLSVCLFIILKSLKVQREKVDKLSEMFIYFKIFAALFVKKIRVSAFVNYIMCVDFKNTKLNEFFPFYPVLI